MLKTCPDPIDVQDIQFKLHCSLKIFDNSTIETFSNNHNLVSCASRYGLLFVGTNTNSLKVIQLKSVENFTPKDKEISKFPKRNIQLPSRPKHVCVNCDSTILAVVLEKDTCSVVLFCNVLSFYTQNISIIKEIRLSATPGIYATEVNWNPALPNVFTACKSDGSLGTYEIKDNAVDINELPQAAESTSFCWSPKGKQIAVGSKNGKITQYKPDLKAVKVINAPNFEGPHSLISLCWVSNYQFIGVYQSLGQDAQAKLVVIDAPKTGETNYTNYDDVCYSGSSRTPQFYFILMQHWNMFMISSSNSMELGLLGASSEIWTQWNVPDFARAELPLAADKQDTLPIGMALDISSTKQVPWGEGTIPPCPYLLLFSHQGVLYFFNIVNLREGMPSICCPPDNVTDMSGIGQFVVEDVEKETKSIPLQPPSSTPAFGTSQPQLLPIQKPQPTLPPIQTTQSSFSFVTPQVSSSTQPTASFGMPQASAPPSISLFSKPVENKSLFSGQVTLTPVKPENPAVSSAALFGNSSVTVTPISKPQSAENAEKYSTIFAALKAPSVIPQPIESKPIVISTQAPKTESHVSEAPKAIPETPKSTAPEHSRSTMDVKSVVDEKVKGETNALLAKMVKDECIALESELKALLHQGMNINTHIGSEEEKIRIVEDIKDLQEFIKEIVEVSLGESSEVHSLKQNLILSWSWYEEALSNYNISKDETMSLILKNQPLDSAAEKRQSDIRKTIYYLESQLYQASKALDEQWDQFQDYAKKTYRVQMPTMEAIFQSMVQQNAVLEKQLHLERHKLHTEKQKGSSNVPSLFLSLTNPNKLEEDLQRLRIDPDDGHRIFYEQSLERNKKLTSNKRNKLRDLLKTREVSHVTSAKPQLNASISLLRSPSTRNKQIFSILGAQMSPVAKSAVTKNLQFMESTPLKLREEFKPTMVPPNTPAQPDPSTTFSFKGINKTSIPPSSTTFIPVPKSTSFFNQLSSSSAFVPTTPTPKTFVIPQSPTIPVASTFSFNFSSKAADSSFSTASLKSNLESTTSIKPISIPKSESTAATTTSSGTANTFFFGGSGNVSTSANTSTVDTQNTSSVQNLFAFGKPSSALIVPTVTTKALTTNISNVSTPTLLSSTPAFAKTTASIISPADSTIKPTATSLSVTSTKPNLFGAPTTSLSTPSSVPKSEVTLTTLAAPTPILPTTKPVTTSKPLDNASSTMSTSTKTTSSGASASSSSFTFSFGATPTTTNSIFGGAVTTTTTSLFGSIAAPSVASSIFGAKPATTADIITPPITTNSFASPTTSVPTSKSTASVLSASTTPTVKPLLATAATTGSILSPSLSMTNVPSIFSSSAATVSSSKTLFGTSVFSAAAAAITSSSPIISADAVATTSASVSPAESVSTTSTPSIFPAAAVATSSTPSIFPAATIETTCTPSIFSTATVATTSSSGSIFGAKSTSAPSSITSSPLFSSAASKTSSASIFASTPASSSTSIFGGATTATPINSTTSSVSSTTKTNIFGATSNQPSAFDAVSSTSDKNPIVSEDTSSTSPPTFGVVTTSSPSIFGAADTSTQPSVFSNVITTSQASIFSTPATTQTSIFGGNATNQDSLFGTATTAQSSIFGTTTAPETTVFGSSATKPASVFGTPVATTSSSIFGAPSSPGGSIFGGAPTTQTSAFGSTNVTSTQSLFGSSARSNSPTFGTSFVQSGSIFGAKTTANNFGSGFGSPSVFGTVPTTTAAFGPPATFGANTGSIFGTPTTTTPTFGSDSNTFGAKNSSSNVFGSGASSSFSFATAAADSGSTPNFTELNVGGTPASGGSIFGGTPSFGQTPPNPFARATEQKFGTPASTTASIFGGSTSGAFGTGTQNAFGSASSFSFSGFGQQSNFGQNSGFGTNPSFGTNTQQPGPFSSGVGVSQAGFGTAGGFQKTGGFGGAPVFGGSPQPVFGGTPSFGGSPAFGGSPSFGSPSKVFGSTTTASAFGQPPTSGSPGFGNMATQNTVGFGSLAQQASTPTSTAFSGSSAFSSWRQ